jgi:hypothetical protein
MPHGERSLGQRTHNTFPLQAGAVEPALPGHRRSGPLGGQRPHEVGKRGG